MALDTLTNPERNEEVKKDHFNFIREQSVIFSLSQTLNIDFTGISIITAVTCFKNVF